MAKTLTDDEKHRNELIKKVKKHDLKPFASLFAEDALSDVRVGPKEIPAWIAVEHALAAEVKAAIAADDPATWRELSDRLDERVSHLLYAVQGLLALRKACEELTYPTDGY